MYLNQLQRNKKKINKEHLVDQGRIQSSDKQNHPPIEPNHFSANQEVCGALKIQNKNAKANISRPSRKQSRKAKEIVNFSPSTIRNDEFSDWEII
uniref:Uncharacterized protein n=1 Tax=Cucumis melo TaxID=3656 RepID=A0A9I9EFU3_CUCME